MKTTFIATVFNEEYTIHKLVESLLRQSVLPDEVIIIDGGSTDGTYTILKAYAEVFARKNLRYTYGIKRGNRSRGRNAAIKAAKNEFILCSDAGNILHKNWIKNIIKPFADPNVDVVAGYNEAKADSIFQKSLIPYVFVMPDKINPQDYLPATRSMAFTKQIWKKVGGFPEKFSHNEDYVFARILRKKQAVIAFAKDAIVYWIPRSTLSQSFVMFFRFALGDAEAGILRKKILAIFLRYIVVVILVYRGFVIGGFYEKYILFGFLGMYIYWSIKKNYRYVGHPLAYVYLPVLQVTSDIAVMAGTLGGLLRFSKK